MQPSIVNGGYVINENQLISFFAPLQFMLLICQTDKALQISKLVIPSESFFFCIKYEILMFNGFRDITLII